MRMLFPVAIATVLGGCGFGGFATIAASPTTGVSAKIAAVVILPFTCDQVRMARTIYTNEQLVAMGKARGITPAQERAARAC